MWIHFLAATDHFSHQLKEDLFQTHLLSDNYEELQPPFLWWGGFFHLFSRTKLDPSHQRRCSPLPRGSRRALLEPWPSVCDYASVLVLLVRVQRSAAMTAGSVSTLMGPWGTNNYELCCQQGTSNHSRSFHNSWAPATMFVLNTPAAGRLTQRRFKKLWITIETRLHDPRARPHAVFCAIDVPGGKNTPGWKRKWQLPWMLWVIQWLIHGSREAEQPGAKRTTFGQTERKENSEDAV